MRSLLSLDSERIAPTGSVIAPGVVKVLGQPDMDLLAVLVREAIQNSWDARARLEGGVSFGVDGWTLDSSQRDFLRTRIFSQCPDTSVLPLHGILESPDQIQVLCLSDRGTVGLGGPTRADVLADGESHFDFVDFLRNVGQPPDRALAGGTYGYGKAAFYRASRAHTICVYTRCRYKGRHESRFIAASLGQPYQDSEHRYTGRHWWGRLQGGIAEPALQDDADSFAAELGLRTFDSEETGTSVLVLQPIFSPGTDLRGRQQNEESRRTPEQAVAFMVEQILLFFWPKMLRLGSAPPQMRFTASWNRKSIRVPDPENYPPLKGYVEAMRRLKQAEIDSGASLRHSVQDVRSQRPAQMLGRLALQQYMTEPYETFDTGETESAFANLTHHTALMRQPELIVRYQAGPPFATNMWGYAGVFITDKEVDSVFAEAEPPTHDDWISRNLENSWHRRYVNVALREIEAAMAQFAAPPTIAARSNELKTIVAFANGLGQSLLPAEEGPSAAVLPYVKRGQHSSGRNGDAPTPRTGHSESGQSSTGASKSGLDLGRAAGRNQNVVGHARVIVHSESLVLHHDSPALQVSFSVYHAKNSRGTKVHAEVSAVVDGAHIESNPPVGGDVPRILLWKSSAGNPAGQSDSILIPAGDEGVWDVLVTLPSEIMINVNLSADSN